MSSLRSVSCEQLHTCKGLAVIKARVLMLVRSGRKKGRGTPRRPPSFRQLLLLDLANRYFDLRAGAAGHFACYACTEQLQTPRLCCQSTVRVLPSILKSCKLRIAEEPLRRSKAPLLVVSQCSRKRTYYVETKFRALP